jgi:hypothetical protein
MFPNNELMYRYARMRGKEIHDEVEAARNHRIDAHILRHRIALLAGVALVGLTLAVTTLALGWWIF